MPYMSEKVQNLKYLLDKQLEWTENKPLKMQKKLTKDRFAISSIE